jgi:hypothetical protein
MSSRRDLEFLKQILEIAKDVLEAERESDPEEERDRAREALTEPFEQATSDNTHTSSSTGSPPTSTTS